MSEQIKGLFKTWGIYGVGTILSKTVGFLMLPVYTHYLAPRDYGMLELLDLLIFFTSIFAAAGIQSAVFRFYSTSTTQKEKDEVISTAFLFFSATSLVFAIAIILLAPWVSLFILGDRGFAYLIRIVAMTLFFSNLSEVPLAYLRAKNASSTFILVNIGRTLLGGSMLALFLAGLKWGILGAVIGNLAANVIGGVALTTMVLAQVPPRLSKDKLSAMIAYGTPLIIQSLGSFVLVFSDRFFLRYYGSLDQVGIYSLSYKIAGTLAVFVSGPFGLTWQSHQFEVAKGENASSIYARVQTYQFTVAVAFALMVSVLAVNAVHLLTPASYWPAANFVPILAMSYVLADMRQVVLTSLYVQKKTLYTAQIAAAIAILNLILNYLLIPRFFILGAAFATVLSYFVSLLMSLWISQKVHMVPYEYGRLAMVFGAASLIYAISRIHGVVATLPSAVLNLALVLFFLPIAYLMLAPEEKSYVLSVRNRILSGIRNR